MQAALSGAVNELVHGLTLGVVLLAGRRCPDCAPELTCASLACPASTVCSVVGAATCPPMA
eukprot:5778363-Lingulodinium_polyedra.AAC.1